MMASRDAAPRVLFLFTQVFGHGGIQRFNQTILDACGPLGVHCRVLSLNDTVGGITKHPQCDNISISGFFGNRRQFAIAAARALLWDRYDRVLIGHINFLTLTGAVLALRRFHAPRTILIAHGIEVWSGIVGTRRLALRHIDRVLCVSRYTRQRILEQAPELVADRLTTFPNALADTWARVAPVSFARNLPARFILSVTRLEPGDRQKGISTVIEAFSMLADESVHYLVIGHGRDLPFLQLVAKRCQVEERVHFISGVSDSELIALYQKCDAFVLPSGKEGFGIVFLEAMFFEAPVIAAGEKGATDVVRDGDTAIVVPFGDVIAVKKAIERLALDAALRERLRTNGRLMVTEDGPFTFARFKRRCAEVFELGEPRAA
ncbi:MAG: glycosyltransferase family 4 protein [Steroidobacteraceae bacterium]